MHRIAKQTNTAIQAAKQIVVVPHPSPDGDTLGAATAAVHYLDRLKKSYRVFCATPAAPAFRYLKATDHLTSDPAVWQETNHDLALVFDAGDLRFAGIDNHLKKIAKKPIVVNIDHHATNEHYGDLNLVDTTASATTEVLYRFFRYNQIAIDAAMATALLTGLMTDTDNFTNGATTPQALAIGSELMTRGGDLRLIQRTLFKNKTLPAIHLWGLALARLVRYETDIAITFVTQADVRETAATDTDVEGIANFLNNMSTDDARASLILKELPDGRWKGSFRTTRSDTDVAMLARSLGGGGHKKAAGFTLPASDIEQAKAAVMEIIKLHKSVSL